MDDLEIEDLGFGFPKYPIPRYRVDLGLHPSKRYLQMAIDLAPKIRALAPVLDNLVREQLPEKLAFLAPLVKFTARLCLRKMNDSEEAQEVASIAKATGTSIHILVILNVLLDSIMGCTSGAALVRPRGRDKTPRLMHFRTLDWIMDELRHLLVELEFVNSKVDKQKIIGRSVTYAGFVGVLTGVRNGLSISLNFRPTRSCSTFQLRTHQALVLLGRRPSVPSILRKTLLELPKPFDVHVKELSTTRFPPCYIILCSGDKIAILQKDLFFTPVIRESEEFLVQTNNDYAEDDEKSEMSEKPLKLNETLMGFGAAIEESEIRMDRMRVAWNQYVKKMKDMDATRTVAVAEKTLIKWVKKDPTMNEYSHFATLMDPKKGDIRWLGRGYEYDW